jgi:hypothetical protein
MLRIEMVTSSAVRERVPALARSLKEELARIGRPDLAAQIDGFNVRAEDRSRIDRWRSFYGEDAPRSYSHHIDLPNALAIIDIAAGHRIVAVHVLRETA